MRFRRLLCFFIFLSVTFSFDALACRMPFYSVEEINLSETDIAFIGKVEKVEDFGIHDGVHTGFATLSVIQPLKNIEAGKEFIIPSVRLGCSAGKVGDIWLYTNVSQKLLRSEIDKHQKMKTTEKKDFEVGCANEIFQHRLYQLSSRTPSDNVAKNLELAKSRFGYKPK